MCLGTLAMHLKHRHFLSVHYFDYRSWMSEQCYLVSAPLWWTEDGGEEKELCKPVVKCFNQCNPFFQVHFLLRFLFCTDCNPFIGCDGLRGRPLNTHELVALVILHTLMDNIRQGVSACSHHFCWHHGSAGCGPKAWRCFDPGRTTWSPVDLKKLPWQCCSPNCLARSLKLFLSSACFQVSEAHKLALVSLTRL